jgi:iron complex outermembrane recepter protein
VHSAYERWSGGLALGLRPAEGAWLELSGNRSDGEAAYADRSMDGVAFDRENVALRFALDRPAPWLRQLEGLAYHNYVDHVMDNFSLRDFTPTATMPAKTVSNPDRRTDGGRLAVTLEPIGAWSGTLGLDAQHNEHSLRSTMNEDMRPYRLLARVDDASFRQWGLFGEFTRTLDGGHRVITGARADRWWARDERQALPLGMTGSVPNPTAGAERDTTLASGFLRYEHALARSTAYFGAGYVERFPDYWELMGNRRETADSLSAFGVRPERTAQLDAGLVYRDERWSLSVSGFASHVDDYLLIESNVRKGMRLTSITRNVEARTYGAEADLALALVPGLRASGSLMWVRGENETDGLPLAQMPPLELRAGLDWQRDAWSAGALVRWASSQDRVAVNQGNVVGQDIGPSPAFTVVSLNAGYRGFKGLRLTAGVDNLFDEAYAEHISRAGAAVAGFEQSTRVNEPGRTLWVSLSAEF